jgi:serine/threonine-protein kinase
VHPPHAGQTSNEAPATRDDLPTLAPAVTDEYTTVPPQAESEAPPTVPPAEGDSLPMPAPAERVSGYEVLGELGRGGMGVVYKARQIALNRVVALKMILSGSHAGQAQVARFRTEAEAIARLQHPNIVQIHEVGESEGRPFFSLELCPGGSLAKMMAGSPLLPEQAARLTEAVAQAIGAAHRANVIHRDLKPANVLLSAEGIPKVSDFGLAKKLDVDAGETQTGAVMGTPSYMAPEQAEGRKDVGPAADVYALGAILYELLTWRPPFKAATALDTLRQVVDNEPVSPRQLNARVPKDLETICLKCLRKDPRQRYAGADDLAEDLARWQRGEPVKARPLGLGARAVKWARRRPTVAALGATLCLALAVALAGWAWFTEQLRDQREIALRKRSEAEEQRGQAETSAARALASSNLAEARFLDVLRAVDQYFTDVSESTLLHEPGMGPLRQKLLRHAGTFYEQFLRQRGDDSLLQREAARSQYRLGLIDAELGDLEGALRRLGDVQARLDQLSAKSTDASVRHDQALAWHHRGRIARLLDRLDEADAGYRKAVELLAVLRKEAPSTPAYQDSQAASLLGLGNVAAIRRRFPEALDFYRRSLDLREQLVEAEPTNETYQRNVAVCWGNLVNAHRALRQVQEARKAEDEALRGFRLLVMADPHRALYQVDLARTLYNAGNDSLQHGAPKQALGLFGEAAKRFELLARTHPAVPAYQEQQARALGNLGVAARLSGQRAREVAAYREARRISRALADAHPEVPAYQADLALSLRQEGERLVNSLRFADGLKCYREAQDRLEAAMRKPPVPPQYRSRRCEVTFLIGQAQRRWGKFDEAQRTLQLALTLIAQLEQEKLLAPSDEVNRGFCYVHMSGARRQAGATALALESAEQALSVAASLRRRNLLRIDSEKIWLEARTEQSLALDQLGRIVEAVGVWDAILSQHRVDPRGYQTQLLRSQARMPDYWQVIPEADRLAGPALPYLIKMNLAQVYCRLHEVIGADPRLTGEERAKRQEAAARAALRLLESADQAGALKHPLVRWMLETDPDFAPLRQRQEFALLLEKIQQGTALGAEEQKWLQEMVNAEADDAGKQRVERDFKTGSHVDRQEAYQAFQKRKTIERARRAAG